MADGSNMAKAYRREEDHWTDALPMFQDIFLDPSENVLGRFSNFSISSLFRSKTALPSLDQVDRLLAAPCTASGFDHARDVARAMREFTVHLRHGIVSRDLSLQDPAVAQLLRQLHVRTLLVADRFTSTHVMWLSEASPGNRLEVQAGVLQSLRQFFKIRSVLVDGGHTTAEANANILQLITATEDGDQRHLAKHLDTARVMVVDLRTRPVRPASGDQHKLKLLLRKAEVMIRWGAADFLHVLEVLSNIVEGVKDITTLPIDPKRPSKSKKEQAEDARRPLRIVAEVELLRADLLLAITTNRINEVKRRALAMLQVTDEEPDPDSSIMSDLGDTKREARADDQAREVKPGRTSKDGVAGRQEDARREVELEAMAETAIIQCLTSARELVENRQAEVLVAHIRLEDWLPSEPSEVSDWSADRLKPDRTDTDDVETCKSDPEGSSYGSDTDTDPDSDADFDSEDGQASHPCPLRTLFRLHDRYEEQRLAVWLHLPADRRGKMGWYMRGRDGRVGTAWDELGVELLREFDPDTLVQYGMAEDKLDKWLDLARSRKGRKARRRGRKSPKDSGGVSPGSLRSSIA
ncbi:hypothetical protein IAU60_000653 [Kwoniella sp. DSM 27419]